MIKLSASGGFGDAVLGIGKLYAADAPFDVAVDQIHVTHFTNERGEGIQDVSLKELYAINNISADVFLGESGYKGFLDEALFDYYLGSGWGTKDGCWEMKPFYEMPHDEVIADVVISPVAAWNNSRSITMEQLESIVKGVPEEKKITYIGRAPNRYKRLVSTLRGENRINEDGVKHLIDIVYSANVVIGHTGFICNLGGIARKKVIQIGNHPENHREAYNLHPAWDITCTKESIVTI